MYVMRSLAGNDREWLQGQLDSLKRELSAQIVDSETKLLTAFSKWASSPPDVKLRVIPALEERLKLLEKRVRDIEMGRNKRR